MNFGVKITILYLSFVALILTMVFMAYGHKVELVSKDYYAQELSYQDKLDAINNTNALKNSIDYEINETDITLTIHPDAHASNFKGTVFFFRPSDSDKDKKIDMQFNNYHQSIPLSVLEHGVYKMQLSWINNNINYYKETVINIK